MEAYSYMKHQLEILDIWKMKLMIGDRNLYLLSRPGVRSFYEMAFLKNSNKPAYRLWYQNNLPLKSDCTERNNYWGSRRVSIDLLNIWAVSKRFYPHENEILLRELEAFASIQLCSLRSYMSNENPVKVRNTTLKTQYSSVCWFYYNRLRIGDDAHAMDILFIPVRETR